MVFRTEIPSNSKFWTREYDVSPLVDIDVMAKHPGPRKTKTTRPKKRKKKKK